MIALTFRVSENGELGSAGEAGGKAEAGRRGQKAGEWERGQVCRGQDRCTASPGPAIPHSERGNEPAGGNRGVSAAEPGLLEPLAPFRRTEHHLSVRVGSRGEGGWVGRTVGPDRRQPRPQSSPEGRPLPQRGALEVEAACRHAGSASGVSVECITCTVCPRPGTRTYV